MGNTEAVPEFLKPYGDIEHRLRYYSIRLLCRNTQVVFFSLKMHVPGPCNALKIFFTS